MNSDDHLTTDFALVAPREKLATQQKGFLLETLVDRLEGEEEWATRLFVVPVRPPIHTEPEFPDFGAPPVAVSHNSSGAPGTSTATATAPGPVKGPTFCSLPYDVHLLIFDAIACIDDAVCLGLTNPYFWAIGRKHLQNYYLSLLGRWAGKNVVFVGHLIEPGDYPPGLFSAAEMDELNQMMEPPAIWASVRDDGNGDGSYGDSHSLHSDWDDNRQFNLSSFALPQVSSHEGFDDFLYDLSNDRGSGGAENYDAEDLQGLDLVGLDLVSYLLVSRLKKRGVGGVGARESTRAWILRNLRVSDATFYTADEPWILRNLTTKEFVRDRAVTPERFVTDAYRRKLYRLLLEKDEIQLSGPIPKPDFVRGPEIGIWGFGEVIMMRTCWTNGDVILDTGKAPMNLTRGPWAGHRFDIRTRASHDAANEHGWTDVSDQVAAESVAVWEEIFGEEWLETIQSKYSVLS
ncbi:hypothetical protein B0T24DRAFT_674877 [Lasiosphaeria ovina]|uniref:Uncharacterized protein n=1 Tax=Lasiosphaeria ovina TaxID=92902 RepID=A0AAE0KM94_9PEZI|nr:hypothetical protein B0T24DRAFT_674877 [Lasiosphaeria ovina]